MAENSASNGTLEVVLDSNKDVSRTREPSSSCVNVSFLQKVVAEVVGTYFLIFAGSAAVVVNKNNDNVVTLPGIAIVWGLVVMVLVYSVGHISGAHFNPAVTIAFASTKRFPFKQVPVYVVAQVLGSTLAAGTLRLLFTGKHEQFSGSFPSGSYGQSFVFEFIITFFLMFVISGVATDNRAIGELTGIAVGSTVLLNVMFAAYIILSKANLVLYSLMDVKPKPFEANQKPISGASMNPARSLGPAFVHNEYRAIWIYIVSPTLGAVAGAWVYNTIRYTDKPVREITESASFLKGSRRGQSSSP